MKTLTLLAAQTDFSEPGELGLFIDESQIDFLDDISRGQGYLSGKQMLQSFQFLHARKMAWTPGMRESLTGEHPTDLMAWNADATRMPATRHHEYLTSLYLNNALATSNYLVGENSVSLGDIRQPIFMVGTEHDHISPRRSIYKLHRLCNAEITFVLASGGHNAGIISEPGHANRIYQMRTRLAQDPWVEPEQWMKKAKNHTGSWWGAWQQWLFKILVPQAARSIPARNILCDAPGEYVLVRHEE